MKIIFLHCFAVVFGYVGFVILWLFFNMKPPMATPEDIARVIKEYPCAKTEFAKTLEKEPLLTNQAEDIGKKCQAKIDSDAIIERQKSALK